MDWLLFIKMITTVYLIWYLFNILRDLLSVRKVKRQDEVEEINLADLLDGEEEVRIPEEVNRPAEEEDFFIAGKTGEQPPDERDSQGKKNELDELLETMQGDHDLDGISHDPVEADLEFSFDEILAQSRQDAARRYRAAMVP
jgi:hypothetical protein